MKSMRKLFMIVGGSALLLLSMLFGAFFAGPLIASAHSTQSAATPAKNATKVQNSPYCELYNQTLAKSLHVSTATLQQDRTSAYKATIDQLVKDGKLTQTQANTLEQNQAKNQACKSFNSQSIEVRAVQRYLRSQKAALENSIAQGLHTTSSNLTAQLKSGKTLNQIAKAQNVSGATLITLIKTTITNQVNSGVSSGTLTKDQGTAFQQYATKHPHAFASLAVRHWQVKTKKAK